jgi:hypothetical protein
MANLSERLAPKTHITRRRIERHYSLPEFDNDGVSLAKEKDAVREYILRHAGGATESPVHTGHWYDSGAAKVVSEPVTELWYVTSEDKDAKIAARHEYFKDLLRQTELRTWSRPVDEEVISDYDLAEGD